MISLFPPVEPYRRNTLKVSELHTLYFEEVGRADGAPAVFLHGGPGVGIKPGYRQFFDPSFYRIILFDQRGAGKSTPHAELRENTTWDLIADLERLRAHLGINKWLVLGGSWGSTLGLSYAITHPTAVVGLILRGIFLGRQQEVDWLFKFGCSELYPDEWDKFIAPIPPPERNDLVAAYYRRLTGLDDVTKAAAAIAFTRWEAATMCLIPDPRAISDMTDIHNAIANARTECHYMMHRCFLPTDGYLLENSPKIRDIPGRIVQGRYDVICPARSAWELNKALPKADLRLVPDGGHSAFDSGVASELVTATEEFKRFF
jgi:proline iminopeptidase